MASPLGATPPPLRTLFLVRHAEKLSDIGDAPLSEAGHARAADLARALQDAGVTHVFSSQYLRAKQTAAPTASQRQVAVTVVPAQDPDALVEQLGDLPSDAVPLVVGHGNTVPLLASALGAGPLEDIPESEYDRLYVLTVHGKSATCVVLRYGGPNPAP